jgi:hypothetical protein
MKEHFFICPYCWERISMILDPCMQNESYIEDCQVCCSPIEINFSLSDDEINFFNIKIIEGN